MITVNITKTQTVCEIRDWLEEYVGWEIQTNGNVVYGLGWQYDIHGFPYINIVDSITIKFDNPVHETLFRLTYEI